MKGLSESSFELAGCQFNINFISPCTDINTSRDNFIDIYLFMYQFIYFMETLKKHSEYNLFLFYMYTYLP